MAAGGSPSLLASAPAGGHLGGHARDALTGICWLHEKPTKGAPWETPTAISGGLCCA